METLKEFDTIWKKRKRTKKCNVCHKLLKTGDAVTMRQVRIEKYYPIKGIMAFARWYARHDTCEYGG